MKFNQFSKFNNKQRQDIELSSSSLPSSSSSFKDVEIIHEKFNSKKVGHNISGTSSPNPSQIGVYYEGDSESARNSVSLFHAANKLDKLDKGDKIEQDSELTGPEETVSENGEITYTYDISQLPPSTEIAKVAVENGGKFSYSSTEVKKLLRQYDKHVLTFLSFLYFLSHLDRGNIGNAKLAGMDRDLRMSSQDFTLIVIIFFLGYIAFQWGILLWKIIKPRNFAPWIIIGWGIISTCSSTVQTWKQLLALRFVLGALEACFSPGIYYYFSFFYHRSEIAKRIGLFQSTAPISAAVSGSIAYGITNHITSHMAPWRLLFIIEGVPSIFAGLVAFYAISNGPQYSRFLTLRQKQIASVRTLEQSGSTSRGHEFNIHDAIKALLDVKIWATMVLYFCISLCQNPLPIFLPSIIEGMGYEDIKAQGMTAPPYILAVFSIIGTAYYSDKYMQRAYAIIICMVVAVIGYLLVALGPSDGSRYLGLFFAVPAVYASLSIIMAWTGDNQGSDSKRGISYVVLHFFGMTGPIVGTTLFPDTDGPRYTKGIWVTTGMIVFIGVFSFVYRMYLERENRKLNEKYGPVSLADIRKCNDDTQPKFRYVL